MDTGTHIVMGVALGGLATLDPAVQQDPALFSAVLAGTVIGSHAPDFDTILKLKIMLFIYGIIVVPPIPSLLSSYGES